MSRFARHIHRHRRGMLLAETLFGLMLMAMVMTMLLLSLARQRAGQDALRDQREITRLAERALHATHLGQPLPDAPEATIDITPLPHAAAPPGSRWVRVTVQRAGRRGTLVGLTAARQETLP